MIWKIITIIGLTATIAYSDSYRRYDITLRRLDTAEEQLLYEQKRTIGLMRFEVDRQLKEVRRQRMEIERLRAGSIRSAFSSSRPPSESAPCQTEHRPHCSHEPDTRTERDVPDRNVQRRYRRPEPDWKTVETPRVVVKGTMVQDGERAALVSGGQIVSSNQVFSTTYRKKMLFWRVTSIHDGDATFERVTESGERYEEHKPTPIW